MEDIPERVVYHKAVLTKVYFSDVIIKNLKYILLEHVLYKYLC